MSQLEFLSPRKGLTEQTVLRLVHAPIWPEKKDYIRGNLSKLKGRDCRLCKLNEEPIQDYGSGYLLEARFPYVPRHAMLVPKGHFQSIEVLPKGHFTQLVNAMGEILVAKPKIVFGANFGEVAGQSISHLHVHVLEHTGEMEERELGIVPLMPSTMIADALGRRIIQRASELGEPVRPTTSLKEYPSVRLLFTNAKELAGSQAEIVKVISGLRKAFASLKRKFPEKTSKPMRRDIQKGIFGYNWLLAKEDNGLVLEIMPRAAGPPIGVLEKSQGERGGMLLNRQKRDPSVQWAAQQQKFYAELQSIVSPQ